MNRPLRILLEVLGPPFLGGVIIMGVLLGIEGEGLDVGTLGCVFLAFMCGSYFIAGIPSILYTVVMESRFARGLDPGTWRSVGWSSLLGLASGALMAGWFATSAAGLKVAIWAMTSLGALGLVVGFLMGMAIKVCSARPDEDDGGIF